MNYHNKHARNRLHSATRWPANLIARLDLAYTDWKFVVVMRRIGCDSIELRRIEARAQVVLCQGEQS